MTGKIRRKLSLLLSLALILTTVIPSNINAFSNEGQAFATKIEFSKDAVNILGLDAVDLTTPSQLLSNVKIQNDNNFYYDFPSNKNLEYKILDLPIKYDKYINISGILYSQDSKEIGKIEEFQYWDNKNSEFSESVQLRSTKLKVKLEEGIKNNNPISYGQMFKLKLLVDNKELLTADISNPYYDNKITDANIVENTLQDGKFIVRVSFEGVLGKDDIVSADIIDKETGAIVAEYDKKSEYLNSYKRDNYGRINAIIGMQFSLKNKDLKFSRDKDKDKYKLRLNMINNLELEIDAYVIKYQKPDNEKGRLYVNPNTINKSKPKNIIYIYYSNIKINSKEDIKKLVIEDDKNNVVANLEVLSTISEKSEGFSAEVKFLENEMTGKHFNVLLELKDGKILTSEHLYITKDVEIDKIRFSNSYQYEEYSNNKASIMVTSAFGKDLEASIYGYIPDKKDFGMRIVDEQNNEVGKFEFVSEGSGYYYVLKHNPKIKEEQSYKLQLKYNGKFIGQTINDWTDIGSIKFTKAPIIDIIDNNQTISNKAGEIFNIDVLVYDNKEALDKLGFAIRNSNDNTNNIDLDIKRIDKGESESDSRNVTYQAKLKNDIDIGQYDLFYKLDGSYYPARDTIYVTSKTNIPDRNRWRDNYYYDKDGNLKKYDVYAINLLKDGVYTVYVYNAKNNYGYYIEKLEDIDRLHTFDGIEIVDGGNINLRKEDLKKMPNGEYRLFFEMDGKLIGKAELNIRDAHDVDGSGFVINENNKATDNKNVSLIINADNYTMIRYAQSKEELLSMPYTALTQEEKTNKKFTRAYTLSDGDGTKTVYMQFKDDSGKESQVHQKSIILDTTAVHDLKTMKISDSADNERYEFYKDENVIIKATGDQDVYVYMNIKDKDNNAIYENIPLRRMGRIGQDFHFEKSINLNQYLSEKDVDLIKVELYAKNIAGKKSNPISKDVKIKKLLDIKGSIMVDIDGDNKDNTPYADKYLYLFEIKQAKEIFVKSIYTDKDGKFELGALREGKYELRFSNLERYYTIKTVNAKPYGGSIKIDIPKDEKVDIILGNAYSSTATLDVKVVDYSDRPVNNGDVSVGSYITGYYLTKNVNNTNVVKFENIPVSTEEKLYYITYKYNNVFRSTQVYLKANDKKTIEIKIPKYYEIKGKVVDSSSKKGVPDIYINVLTDKGYYSGVLTDENGEYTTFVEDNTQKKAKISFYSDGIYLSNFVDVLFGDSLKIQAEDLVLSTGARLQGRIVDSKTGETIPNTAFVLYKDGKYYRYMNTDEKGSFELNIEQGKYSVFVYNIFDANYQIKYNTQNSKEILEITKEDFENVVVKKQDFKIIPKEDKNRFETVISSDVNYITQDKEFTITAKIKNISDQDLKNVKISADFPANATLVKYNKFPNTKEKVVSIKKGKTESISWIFKAGQRINNEDIVVKINSDFEGKKEDLGYAKLEYVIVTLNAPSSSTKKEVTVYGESNEAANISIVDAITGKLLATTKSKGRWYSAKLNLEYGKYKLYAVSQKEKEMAMSAKKDLVIGADVYDITDLDLNANGSKKLPANRYTGVPAFSVWARPDHTLKPINIRFTLKGNLANVKSVVLNYKGDFETRNDALTFDENGRIKHIIEKFKASRPIQLKVIVKTKDDEIYEFIIADLTVLIDPSGYIYDKYSKEKLPEALAVLEVLNENGKWENWDAELYGQINPMPTDKDGEYAWMVPKGKYRVKVVKEGYLDVITDEIEQYKEGIIIPPPALDVNIPMVNISMPNVEQDKIKVSQDNKTVEIPFNKAMNKDSIKADTVSIRDERGVKIEGEFKLSENNKTLIFTSKKALDSEKTYTIDIKGMKDFSEKDKYTARELIFVGEFKTNKIEAPDTGGTPGGSSGGGSGGGGGGGGGSSSTTKQKDETKKEDKKEDKQKSSTDEEEQLPSLKDIQNHWAKEYIQKAIKRGIVAGYPDKTFKPNNQTTRAEFVQMLVKAKNLNISTYKGKFKDVKPSNWFAAAVQTAIDNGLLTGYEDNTFRANNAITRAEMIVMIMSSDKTKLDEGEVAQILSKFKDKEEVPKWARMSVAKAIKANIISGYKGKINPKSNATRAEVVTVLIKLTDN